METDEMARRRARRLDNSRLRKYRDKNAPKVSVSLFDLHLFHCFIWH